MDDLYESAGSGLNSVLGAITQATGTIASTAGTLLDIQKNRDALDAYREERQFQQYLRGTELQLARDKVAIGSEVERTRAQVMLEQARAALSPATFRWDIALGVVSVAIGTFALFSFARGRR